MLRDFCMKFEGGMISDSAFGSMHTHLLDVCSSLLFWLCLASRAGGVP